MKTGLRERDRLIHNPHSLKLREMTAQYTDVLHGSDLCCQCYCCAIPHWYKYMYSSHITSTRNMNPGGAIHLQVKRANTDGCLPALPQYMSIYLYIIYIFYRRYTYTLNRLMSCGIHKKISYVTLCWIGLNLLSASYLSVYWLLQYSLIFGSRIGS